MATSRTLPTLSRAGLSLALAWLVTSAACHDAPKDTSNTSSTPDKLEAFPPAGPGEVRHVVQLDAEKDEPALELELIVGRTMDIDCNTHSLSGDFETVKLAGSDHSYYRFTTDGMIAATKIGCGDEVLRSAFVSATPLVIAYDSRVPVVVYIPEGYELRHQLHGDGEPQD